MEGFAVLANMLIIGGVGGFFIGYVLKKVVKILLMGLGVLVFVLAALALIGTIDVNYDGLIVGVSSLFNPQQLSMILQALTNYLPAVAGFAIGFLLAIAKQ